MLTFAVLGLLAFFTLEGRIRAATLVFLGGFSLKTWIVEWKRRAAEAEEGSGGEAAGKETD